MVVKFNLESDVDNGFYAIYSGLRLVIEKHDKPPIIPGQISLVAAEAYCMLRELEQKYTVMFNQAKEEYNNEICASKP